MHMNRSHVLLAALVLGCGPTTPAAPSDAATERGCVYGELAQSIEIPTGDITIAFCLPPRGIEAEDCVVVELDPSGTCAERAGREAVAGDPTRCRLQPGADGFWIESDPEACGFEPSEEASAVRFGSLVPDTLISIACRVPEGC
jgi:hypothetical protein